VTSSVFGFDSLNAACSAIVVCTSSSTEARAALLTTASRRDVPYSIPPPFCASVSQSVYISSVSPLPSVKRVDEHLDSHNSPDRHAGRADLGVMSSGNHKRRRVAGIADGHLAIARHIAEYERGILRRQAAGTKQRTGTRHQIIHRQLKRNERAKHRMELGHEH
jgi:hypothetical protein